LALLAGVALLFACPRVADAADPWLFVNDVHLNVRSHNAAPVGYGADTNAALLESALAEMRRIAPHPAVVVMAGDFVAHHARRADALSTLEMLARRFDRAFPRAQFVIALGNEDSPCGDYAVPPNSSFLRAVATAWAPLVNRNGAAPDFVRTFSRDGFYTTRLPLHGVRAVVVNDTLWSPLYHVGCGKSGDPTPQSFAELDRALRPGVPERRWLVMHIPPGVDAGSTLYLVHHLAIVPFLRPGPRDRLVALVGDPARHVEVVVTGHLHRFAYRLIERTDRSAVPVLIAPAISPIYYNAPAFLTATVTDDGTIRALEEHALPAAHWRDVGGLGSLGVPEFSGAALRGLQNRLERDPALRDVFGRLFMGGAPLDLLRRDGWRPHWCAATGIGSSAYRACLDEGGIGFLTRRGAALAGTLIVAGAVALAAAIALTLVVRRRRRAH
jgi:predicted phosphodiesterase